MHIAIDARALLDGQPSGVQEYTTNSIRALLRVAPQHDYHLFYNSAKQPQMPTFSGPHVTWHAFRYPNKLFNGSQWLLDLPQWDRLINADVFYIPSLRLVPLHPTKPLVTVVHDLSFERFPEFFSWQMRLWHQMMRPRLLLNRSNHLITISHSTAADVRNLYGISPDKISVIYAGVTPLEKPTQQIREQVRQKYTLPRQFILYFGTLEPRKNITSIIKSFSAIAHTVPHDLVLAGRRGWLPKALDQALHSSPVKERIHFPGIIAHDDKAALYALADLFVYPSFYEGFGFPPLEALSQGTPVITSYNSSLPEVVGDWATLVNPYDVSELALVMKELVMNKPTINADVGQEIMKRYAWDTAGHQTMAVIEKICG